MKILFFTDSLASGGKERRLTELMKSLVLVPGIEFQLVVMNADVHYKEVFNLGIEIHQIIRGTKKDLSIFRKLYHVCLKFRPDVLHCWDSMTAIYSIPVCRLLGIKLVNGMVVDTPVERNVFNKYWLRAKLTFPFSTVVVGNSNAGLKAYGASQNRSICIYNGMDLNRFENLKPVEYMKKEIFGTSSTEIFTVGMVAAFEDRKDYNTLINAAIKLTLLQENIRFVLVGGGINFDEMNNKVPAQLKDKILFLGKRSDVESIVNIFDIGVLLTNAQVHGEGISNSIIEYMALSKPVIATRGGGTDELITDGYNGFLLDSGDMELLINRITVLSGDRELRSKLGINARQMVVDKFDLRKMTNEYIDLYVKLLSK